MKKSSKKEKKVTIDSLAMMIANGFKSVDKRFDSIEGDITEIKTDITEIRADVADLKDGQKKINSDILNIGDKYISRFEFDNLATRVSRIEEKGHTRVGKR